MEFEHDDPGEDESRPFHGAILVKVLAILFVIAIYVVIFLKILFLE